MREFDALHFPAHMDAPSWSTKRCIVTVLDLIPLIMKDLYKAEQAGWRFELARFGNAAIKRASLILAISETTKRDVQRLLQIPEERIVVTPLGVDERFFASCPQSPDEVTRVCQQYGINLHRPLLLYVGGIDPRKNWQVLLPLLRQVIQAERSAAKPPPVLMMAGRIQGDKQFPAVERMIRDLQSVS